MKLQFKRIAEVHDATVSRAWSVVCGTQLCGIFIEWNALFRLVAGRSFLKTVNGLSTEQAKLVRAFATERIKRGLELDDARLEV